MSEQFVVIALEKTLRTEECVVCGIIFAMTEKFYRTRSRNKDDYYCPSGHPQHYLGQTHEEQLTQALNRADLLKKIHEQTSKYIQSLTTKNKNLRAKLAKAQKKAKP